MAPPKKPKGKKWIEEPGPSNRLVSAKELRNKYTAIKNSPDGEQKSNTQEGGGYQKLQPACVECDHCRLPVYPDKAKVATQATFERLELKTGGHKDEEAAKKAAAEKAEERKKERDAADAEVDDEVDAENFFC